MRETGDFLSSDIFRDINALNKFYNGYRKGRVSKKLRIDEVIIFVIMDVDGDGNSLNSFKSKNMFHGSVFYENIIPIVNNPNMDDIFKKAGFQIADSNKPESYRKIMRKINSLEQLCDLLKDLNTDLPMMIKELKKHCSNFQR